MLLVFKYVKDIVKAMPKKKFFMAVVKGAAIGLALAYGPGVIGKLVRGILEKRAYKKIDGSDMEELEKVFARAEMVATLDAKFKKVIGTIDKVIFAGVSIALAWVLGGLFEQAKMVDYAQDMHTAGAITGYDAGVSDALYIAGNTTNMEGPIESAWTASTSDHVYTEEGSDYTVMEHQIDTDNRGWTRGITLLNKSVFETGEIIEGEVI